MRWRRAIEWTAFGIGAAGVTILGLSAAVVLAVGDPRPIYLGNRPENVIAGTLGGTQFRFAVLGDTQKGTTGLRRMLTQLSQEKPAFYVHTGDLVSENDLGHYRLAQWTLVRANLLAPMIVVPGNHDIKRNTHLFETRIGPLETAFSRGSVRFITADDALGAPPRKSELEKRLKAAGDAVIVLFMHRPPWNAKAEVFEPLPGFEETVALIRAYRVRYVFSGHVHVYRRIEHGGTVWIASGIGGDYGTIVDVDGRKLADRRVELEPSHSLWDNVEHLALGHVAQAYRSQPIWTWAGTMVILGAWIWLVVRQWRKKPAA